VVGVPRRESCFEENLIANLGQHRILENQLTSSYVIIRLDWMIQKIYVAESTSSGRPKDSKTLLSISFNLIRQVKLLYRKAHLCFSRIIHVFD